MCRKTRKLHKKLCNFLDLLLKTTGRGSGELAYCYRLRKIWIILAALCNRQTSLLLLSFAQDLDNLGCTLQ